jgi:hypothetical protein
MCKATLKEKNCLGTKFLTMRKHESVGGGQCIKGWKSIWMGMSMIKVH